MFDDISPEEEARYMGYASAPMDAIDAYEAPVTTKKKGSRSYTLLEEEEDDAIAQQPKMLVQQEVIDEKDLENDPLMQMDWLVSIQRMGPRRIVPCDVGTAAETMLNAHRERRIELPRTLQMELASFCNQVDEFTRIDPLVVVSTKLDMSDTFSAFLQEQMPVSLYLLARVSHARFQVFISEKTKTRPIAFNDPEVVFKVEPYMDRDADGQPFHIEECLDNVDDAKVLQIRAYMMSLGKLSPRQACDLDFLEAQEEMFKSILSGEKVIVRPKKKSKV